jgi:hypothetical protein
VPLFLRHGVDAYLSGHDHSLAHVKWNEVHYVVSGGGGAQIQKALDYTVKSSGTVHIKPCA